jgi:signal peptidase I
MTLDEKGPRRTTRGCFLEIVETVVLTVVVFLGIQTFVAQPFQVQQDSLQATLQAGQDVLIDKLTPRWSPYQRGDIVVFSRPEGAGGPAGIPLIKRVIGLPGEHVELVDGKVFVDGRELAEPYLYAEGGVAQATHPTSQTTSWIVPAGEVFVMGDHRRVSDDSRVFGPIQVSSVVGRAVLRYWPIGAFELIQRPSYR